MAQIRANFLVLAVLLVAVGLTSVYKYHTGELNFNWLHASLIALGVVLAHISVNLFNEYSDYKTGIDFNTQRTPFSGGSGILSGGKTTPAQVLAAAVISLLGAAAIGIYFTLVAHWSILLIVLLGAFTIVFYTNLLTRYMLGELFSGLTLGTLVVLGTYIAMTATPRMQIAELLPMQVILISIPPGILTSLLLLLNEFPDVEADRKGGRKHIVVLLGLKKAAWVYAAGIFSTFLVLLLIPLLGFSGPWFFIAMLTLPLGLKATVTAIQNPQDMQQLVPALGANVITVLTTNLLMVIGILL